MAQPKTIERLAPHPSHKIDRDRPVTFTFNGRRVTAFAGDTVAGALWAAGHRMLGRSFKYHRPRGPFALTSGDTNALLRIDDEPNARAAVRLVEDGLAVASQNTWPSLRADVMSLSRLGSRFMPVGFYYKTFIRPRRLWPTYERVLRNVAGLGHITHDAPDSTFDKKYEFADVLVIGGGPAGLSAALAAADAGAAVLLLDENPHLGGHLAYQRQPVDAPGGDSLEAWQLAEQLARQVQQHPNIRVALQTSAFGVYDQLWIGASQNDTRLLKIRAGALVVANGAFEQPLLFENSDLPGVILGSMAQRLMHLYGIKPGQRAVVLSGNRDGLQVALDLRAAGVAVAQVLELRDAPDADLSAQLAAAGIPLSTDRVVIEARGDTALSGVITARVDKQTPLTTGGLAPQPGTEAYTGCDLLVVSAGWTPAVGLLYQAHAKLGYDDSRGEFLPTELPPGVFAAGRVNGCHTPGAELLDGELAGRGAAAFTGHGDAPSPELSARAASARAAEPVRTSKLVTVPGGPHQFISFDEDVALKDVADSVAEGYNSMELLKRYSTLSMGPSQGKYESANTMALFAAATGQEIAAVGTTTSRPPFTSVPLGVLAGRQMEPVKLTPMHGWHARRGAKMMNAGLWKRPEHYGDPAAEVLGTRGGLGLIDVSTLGKLQLRGPDVAALLERLYTNRWRKLGAGRARYGVMVNEEGIITDDGVAARLDDDTWYITTTSSGADGVYENLLWNLQSGWNYRVHVLNVTDAYAAMNLTGPQARAALQPLTDLDLSNEACPYMAARRATIAGVPAIVLRIGFTGELGYEIHTPAGYGLYLWETLLQAGATYGITPFGVEAQRVMRLEKGHFIVGQDTDGLTDPLMADLDWAVKLDKPDFVGKPSLVRVRRRGVSQKLVGYRMLDPAVVPEEANQIVVPNPAKPLGLEIIGRVTSSRYSPTLGQSIGLCWLPVSQAEPGREFTVRIRGELHTGQVVSLPFYDAEGARLRS
ncbi:MAG: 2Fe-2S iron-sulfur cluster-binding protein [Anaerolineae bacterium]